MIDPKSLYPHDRDPHRGCGGSESSVRPDRPHLPLQVHGPVLLSYSWLRSRGPPFARPEASLAPNILYTALQYLVGTSQMPHNKHYSTFYYYITVLYCNTVDGRIHLRHGICGATVQTKLCNRNRSARGNPACKVLHYWIQWYCTSGPFRGSSNVILYLGFSTDLLKDPFESHSRAMISALLYAVQYVF